MSEPIISRVMSDSSLEISKNSRGFTYSVKAYGKDTDEIKNKVTSLIKDAEEVIKELGETTP